MITNAILTQRIAALEVQVAAYGTSHLGILSGPAIRYELSLLTAPVDLLVYDWRKQNEWNSILGWDAGNAPLGQSARIDYAGIDRRHATRAIDLRGQYGGDEIVMAVDCGSGRGLLARLLRELITLNAGLSAAQHQDISDRTGGLISGFCVAAVLVESTAHALLDAARAVDMTGVLKKGIQTGARATSGARGTVIGRLNA
jgi:hypothetical protein